MKKFFFLAYLLGGISSSYAMDIQIEADGIVLLSSHGQKTRKLSLDPQDPAADLRLHPSRGETLWYEEKQCLCDHPYLDGKVYSFLYPEALEITLSYPAWNADLLSIAYPLMAYNLEKTGLPGPAKMMKASYKNVEEESVVSCVGKLHEHTLAFSFNPEEAFAAPHEFCSLLRGLQKAARQENIHMMRTGHFPVHPISSILQAEGFLSTGEITALRTGQNVTGYYKKLHCDPDEAENASHVMIKWKTSNDTFSPPRFKRCFGIFIRDDKHSIRGGISGNIYRAAAFPFSQIEIFHLDESLRGTGLGKKIFLMAENFSKENGAHCVQLDTMDYQAPWFYKRMGYTSVFTEYEAEKTVDGKWVNGYLFRKTL